MTEIAIANRLEELRVELRAERISYGDCGQAIGALHADPGAPCDECGAAEWRVG